MDSFGDEWMQDNGTILHLDMVESFLLQSLVLLLVTCHVPLTEIALPGNILQSFVQDVLLGG